MPIRRRVPAILVVDDDRATRHVTRAVLTKAGYKVRVAPDGAQALTRLRTGRFDLMLLDVWMPRMDGLQLLAKLKGRQRTPRIIVMTSDDTPETLLGAIRQRAFQYVRKPIEPQALRTLVRDVLAQGPAPPIDIISARPDWVEIVVPCTREAADRLQEVMKHLEAGLSEEVRDAVAFAFRELLFNAIEWGGKLDPKRKVRIAYLRAKRMLIYRIADPGRGFTMEGLDHAAISHPDDPIKHMEIRELKKLRPGGFGLLSVRASVDELIYNERQNEVVFVKYLD
jgi:CheY-like chemotaxis protein